MKALMGVLLIALSLGGLFVFRQQTLNILVYFTLVALLALGLGILTHFLTGQATFQRGSNGQKFQATNGFLAFTGVLILGIYFYFKANQTFDYVVYLRDKQQQTVLKNKGALQILLNNTPRVESVDQYGRVVFAGIPAELKETFVRAELIDCPDWSFDNSTKTDTFSLTDGNATLWLTPDQSLCCIRGIVTNKSGQPLAKATVWANQIPSVHTDELGRFTLKLPLNRQNGESIRVYAHIGKLSVSVYATARQEVNLSIPIP